PGDTAAAETISAVPTPTAPVPAEPLVEESQGTAAEVVVPPELSTIAPVTAAPADGEALVSIVSAPEQANPEPELVEVWRIGRSEGPRPHRRPRPGQSDRRRDQRAAVAVDAVAASPVPAGEGDVAIADSAAAQAGDGQATRENRRP